MQIALAPSTMTSREMADLTEKRHDSVKRTIDTLAEKGVISQPQIVDGEKAANGVTESVYKIGERDSYVVVAQLSPEFTARVVDRWQELEAAAQVNAPVALSRMDILKLAMESEQRAIQFEAERDQAIATKAHIGNKREATAMATASAAKREVVKLLDQLGANGRHATIKAVEKITKQAFAWRPLRQWCAAHNVSASDVTDPLYGTVKSWPADAWGEIYGVDLQELFCKAA